MDYNAFMEAIQNKTKPKGMNKYLEAMYEDALGNWDKAHEIAQNIGDSMGSLIHAYLHREEGDQWNANYWYHNAGRKMPSLTLEKEWESITKEIIDTCN